VIPGVDRVGLVGSGPSDNVPLGVVLVIVGAVGFQAVVRARREAVAGAVAPAGAMQAAEKGDIRRDATITCLVTGSAFKDEEALAAMVQHSKCPVLTVPDVVGRLE